MQLTANDSLESRIKVRRLIRRAMVGATVVVMSAGVAITSSNAMAALEYQDNATAGAGQTVNVDSANNITGDVTGTLGKNNSISATGGGHVIANGSTVNITLEDDYYKNLDPLSGEYNENGFFPKGSIYSPNWDNVKYAGVGANGAGSSLTMDDVIVNGTKAQNGIVGALGGAHVTISNSIINGSVADSDTLLYYYGLTPMDPAGVGIQTILSQDAGSNVTLNNVTVNTTGYTTAYHSAGIVAQSNGSDGSGTITLGGNINVVSHGDKTGGIEAGGYVQGGIINTDPNHPLTLTVTTDGANSPGINVTNAPTGTVDPNFLSSLELNAASGGGSSITTTGANSPGTKVENGASATLSDIDITTTGANSDGVLIEDGGIATLNNSTVNPQGSDSAAVHFTGDGEGSFTGNTVTLNGDIISEDAGVNTVTLNGGSVLNGAISGVANFNLNNSTWNNTGLDDVVIHNFTNGNFTFASPVDPTDPSQYPTLTVDNFTANPGSSIGVNIYADGENSLANKLIINDSYTSDPATPYNSTEIKKNFTNGYHALPENGLVVVQGTNPGAFAAGDFYDPDKLGIYTYYGSFSTDPITNDPQFALYSKINGAVAAISALPALGSSVALSTLPNVQDRMHAPRSSVTGTGQGDAQRGIWARLFGGHDKFRSDKSGNVGFDNSLWAVQAGYDLMAKKNADGGRNYAGLYLAYGDSSGDAQVNGNNVGRLDLDATSVGAYWTTYTPSNTYLSVTGQYSWFSSIKASGEGETADPNGSGFALSLEGGKTLHDDKSVVIEPQAQLIYQHTKFDNVTLPAGGDRPADTPLSISNMNAVTGRLGVLFRKNRKSGENFLPWAKVNLWHTFSGSSKLDAPLSDQLDSSMKGTSLEARIGFNFLGNDNSNFSVSADGGYLFDIGGAKNSGWRGSIGAAYKW